MNIFKYIFSERKVGVLSCIALLFLGLFLISIGYNNLEASVLLTVVVSVGTSLIASSIVAFLDLWRQATYNIAQSDYINIVSKAGIVKVFHKRDLDEYDNLIDAAKERIDITGYSLRAFSQSYKDILLEKLEKEPNLKIRMLIVDPNSYFSKQREVEEEGSYREVYRGCSVKLKEDFSACKNVEIREVSTALSTMIFRIDDVMYVGPHFYKKSSKSTHTLKLKKDGWMFQAYQDEFDRMWNYAK